MRLLQERITRFASPEKEAQLAENESLLIDLRSRIEDQTEAIAVVRSERDILKKRLYDSLGDESTIASPGRASVIEVPKEGTRMVALEGIRVPKISEVMDPSLATQTLRRLYGRSKTWRKNMN